MTSLRVHSNVFLTRSKVTKVVKVYREYSNELRNDFQQRCGYCFKPEYLTTKGFEIDHFVPRTVDEGKKNDYNNLVYSCFTCNRKKGGKWPTKESNMCNDGVKGFIDPLDPEFDKHLGRSVSGDIEYYSTIGKYMCEDAFKFNVRPIGVIWKMDQLKDRQKKLSEYLLRKEDSQEDLSQNGILLARVCLELQKLTEYIFNQKE